MRTKFGGGWEAAYRIGPSGVFVSNLTHFLIFRWQFMNIFGKELIIPMVINLLSI